VIEILQQTSRKRKVWKECVVVFIYLELALPLFLAKEAQQRAYTEAKLWRPGTNEPTRGFRYYIIIFFKIKKTSKFKKNFTFYFFKK